MASDQTGALYLIEPGPIGAQGQADVRRLPLEIGRAQGLTVAGEALYVVVNNGRDPAGGLYRATDSDGDGLWDQSELLRPLGDAGEHGPHAVIPSADGESLYVSCGNVTKPTEFAWSRAPRVWHEDVLLPRIDDPMRMFSHLRAPGGWIARTDLHGREWELIAMGFRNQYDIALDKHGELFTFDADNEYDVDTPWYRPTRVCHVPSGAEFGWRHGTGKWPTHYEDSVPPVVDVGPGSPTGVTFGYRTHFPAKYRNALFAADWSHGRVFAVHPTPDGSGYSGTFEPFVTATPLPVTDLAVNPADGALYLTTGGRRIASALYRVVYTGEAPALNAPPTGELPPEALLREELESLHTPAAATDPDSLDDAWPHLGHADRGVRYAARVAVELQPLARWWSRALNETSSERRPYALLAAARCFEGTAPGALFTAIRRTDFDELSRQGKLTLLRAAGVLIARHGTLGAAAARGLVESWLPHFPGDDALVNRELAAVLLALGSADAVGPTVTLLDESPLQTDRIYYAHALTQAEGGWTRPLRRRYYTVLSELVAAGQNRSMQAYMERLAALADENLDGEARAQVADLIAARYELAPVSSLKPRRPFVRKWTQEEVTNLASQELDAANLERGRRMFAGALCFQCHRFGREGGAVGPDLTTVAQRFTPADIAEAIVEPNAVVSDQYRLTAFSIDGETVIGRIVNLEAGQLMIATDISDPKAYRTFRAADLEDQTQLRNSPMPTGLVDVLDEQELRDLLAFLQSSAEAGGDTGR